MSSWLPWPFRSAPAKKPYMRPADAARDPALRLHFETMLHRKRKFCPSEVAGELSVSELANLGYDTWQDAMPAVLDLLQEFRALGDCEVLQNGKVVPESVDIEDLKGPMRVRRTHD